MLVAFILLLFVGGIALAQAVSDPHAVTLRWLRLGGIIAITLLAVAVTVLLTTGDPRLVEINMFAVVVAGLIAQLVATQLGNHHWQRSAAILVVGMVTAITSQILNDVRAANSPAQGSFVLAFVGLVNTLLIAALLGGCLMTMLLGHAYLTAGGEMTQKPFMRLVHMLVIALVLRATLVMLAGFLPWYRDASAYGFGDPQHTWQAVMVCARLLVGIVVPGVLLYMVRDCVRRRANQSATGILYVLAVTLIVGEGVAMLLVRSTGWAF